MIEAELDSIYQETDDYVRSLATSLIAKHLANPLATPVDYDYDVKSFCVLCHAALEDYAETLAIKVMSFAIDQFTINHRLSESLITLMHFKSNKGANYFDKLKDNNPIVSLYDYIRETLVEIKNYFSTELLTQNHGVSVKYLRQILMPVAINIPNDLNLLNSLNKLASERGFYAHRFLDNGVLKRSIAPEEAKNIMEDCLLLCWEIRNQAKDIFKI